MDEEPDYEALWERIVAHAEQEAERQRREAEWLEEAGRGTEAFYASFWAAQRRASKAYIRTAWQQFDLAAAICNDDLAGYIDRWYSPSPSNGSRIEWKVIHRDEAHLIPGYIYEESEDDDATLWRAIGGGTAGVECQAGSHLQNRVPAEHARALYAHVRSIARRAYAWAFWYHCHRRSNW